MKHLAMLFAIVALAACGSKSKGGETADPCKDKKMPMFEGPLEEGQWEKLSKDERKDFMAHVVVPTMKKKFQEFDPQEFGEFNCGTCHGANAGPGGSFEMPNADLPVLTMEMFQNPPEEDKMILEFMMGTVKPAMAEMLGMPEKSETQDGFGCDNCHTFSE